MANGLSTTEVLSVVAGLISAIGGAFAAWAAWLSARSARDAQAAAAMAEHRSALRELTAAASGVLVEARRVQGKAIELKQAHQALATLSGALGGSRLRVMIDGIAAQEKEAQDLAQDAGRFADGAQSLKDSTGEDIDRVQQRISHSLNAVRAMREEMEARLLEINAQCAERREGMDKARFAR